MKKKLKKICLSLVLGTILLNGTSALAFTVYDPTNHAENLETKLQAIEMVKQQIESVNNQLKDLAKLPSGVIEQQQEYIVQLTNYMNEMQVYLNEKFQEVYKEQEEISKMDQEERSKYGDDVIKKTSKDIEEAMRNQELISQMEQDNQSLQGLLNQAQNAEGTVALAQINAQIASLQIVQSMRLQQIITSAERAKMSFYQRQVEYEKMAKDDINKIFGDENSLKELEKEVPEDGARLNR